MNKFQYISFPDVIRSVLQSAGFNHDNTVDKNGRYIPGTIRHIAERIAEYERSPGNKGYIYPVVGLIHSFPEDFKSINEYCRVSFSLHLIELSGKESSYDDRIENTFKTVLYPLWESIIEGIRSSKLFILNDTDSSMYGVPHRKFDRLNWGRTGPYGNLATELNKHIDGIELTFNDLRLNQTNCLKINYQKF